MNGEVTEAQLVEYYGLEALVITGGPGDTPIQLGQAQAMEAMFCPAAERQRQDPELRARKLARMLHAAGTLEPPHEHLLEESE